jgi:phage shock protein C
MFCTRCGFELRDSDRFCSRCGARTSAGPALQKYQPLLLDKRNRKIAGVCAGFARYFDVDVVLFRVLTLVLALCTGVGFLAYIAAWIVIPSDRGLEPERIGPSADSADLTFLNS